MKRFEGLICFALAYASFSLGQTTPAFAQQTYRMIIQSDPAFGRKCLDVPFGSQAAGVRVQNWDCNDGRAQVFTYEEASKRLKFGNLCVVSWGNGVGGDPVGIDLCDFEPNQRSQKWDVTAAGDAYRIIGVNGLCLDIRGGNPERGSPLNIWACNKTVSQLFTLIEAK